MKNRLNKITLCFLLFFPMLSYAKNICSDLNINIEYMINPIEIYKVIDINRLYFYSAPNKKCKIKELFVIAGDKVVVYGSFGEFYYAMYIGKESSVEGWLRKKYLINTNYNINNYYDSN